MNVYTDNRRPVEVPEAEVTNNRPTRSALGRAHIPPTKVFRRLAVNKTILKPRVAAATGGQYVYVGFSRRNKISRCSAYTISEKTIRFRHPDYNPDRAQKLISSSTSRHLSTRNISSKSTHAFWSNLANRQTDKRTRAKTCTSSFVGGKKTALEVLYYWSYYWQTQSIAQPLCDSRASCFWRTVKST